MKASESCSTPIPAGFDPPEGIRLVKPNPNRYRLTCFYPVGQESILFVAAWPDLPSIAWLEHGVVLLPKTDTLTQAQTP